jgi:peptidoglycan/LPS O-acetylase OafA/YrhL
MGDNRIHYLDGLRGLLAMIVFIHHFLYIFYPGAMLGGSVPEFLKPGVSLWKIIALTPVNIIFNPGMAINFFFLLSGFVQSFHYLKNPDLHLVQMSFMKRYLRLALPTMAVLLLVFIFNKLHFIHTELLPVNAVSANWIKGQLPDTLNFLQVLKYGFFDCFQGNRSYYQVLWTMPVELVNSWLILILLFVTHNVKHKNGFFIFWILVQVVLLRSTYGISFTLGLLLCSLHLHSLKFKKVFSHTTVKCACLLIGLYFASFPFMEYQDSIKNSMYLPISVFGSDATNYIVGNAFLFCFLLYAWRIKIIFSKKMFQFFGEISFMFYLVHFLLLFSISPMLYANLQPRVGLTAALVITFLATFGITTLVAFVLYNYVDKPCLKFCNRYTKKLLGI